MHEVFSCGFPHSDISGSRDICSSPKLFAAYHVFHRLPVPRHSPCALVRLTFQTFFQNVWYPLDSLFCQRRLLLPFLLKLQYFLKELTIIFVSQLLFSFQGTSLVMFPQSPVSCNSDSSSHGGPKWTRTIDLTIISRVL